jgi:hypothetical protein
MQKLRAIPLEITRRLAAFGQVAGAKEREFMKELSLRQREPNGFETEIDQLISPQNANEGFSKKEALDFFKKLEFLGCGKLLLGRREFKTRLRWTPYGAIAVSQAFLGGLVASHAESPLDSSSGVGPLNVMVNEGMHTHLFLLRQGLQVSFQLPLDLNKEEANRLAEFIRTLPF